MQYASYTVKHVLHGTWL